MYKGRSGRPSADRRGAPGHRARPELAIVVACLIGGAVLVIALSGTFDTPGSTSRPSEPFVTTIHTHNQPQLGTELTRDITLVPRNADQGAPGVLVPSGLDESDPVLLADQGRYYLYASGIPGSPSINVPVSSATSFDQWSPVTDALPVLPPWALPGFTWAPDVHRYRSGYVLYFTSVVKGTSPAMECIGSATGPSAAGPFTPTTSPFICQADQGGSIDPRVFTDSDGSNWMVWKSDQNIGGATVPTKVWSQPLAPDGLSLTGSPTAILAPDEPWQGTIVEAPDMVEVGGVYWVFYSGNWFNQPEYAIGAARCAGPQGPCADVSTSPLLASNLQGQGPGEASVYSGPDGVWMLYSPWRSLAPKADVPPRPVYITRIGFAPNGPFLAAGGPPPSFEVLDGQTTWPAS